MSDNTYGVHLATDFEILGGTVDGMDVEKMSREELRDHMDAATAAVNRAVNLVLGELALPTTNTSMLMDQAPALGEWDKGTETGRGERRKTGGLGAVAFPVTKYGPIRMGWSRDYLKKATNFELVRDYRKVMDGYFVMTWKEAMRALFQNTTWDWSHDMFPEDGTLKIKPLLNADGYIAPDWNTNTFDGTETHYQYLGSSGTLDEADLETIADTLRSHGLGVATGNGGLGGRIEVWINSDQTADAKAHTNYVAPNDPVVANINKTFARGLDADTYVGYNSSARVFIREVDYVPSGYVLGFVTNSQPNADSRVARVNGFAPLRRRLPNLPSMQGIQGVDETKFPLQERFWEVWQGFGVGNRITAICAKLDDAAYSVPTIS